MYRPCSGGCTARARYRGLVRRPFEKTSILSVSVGMLRRRDKRAQTRCACNSECEAEATRELLFSNKRRQQESSNQEKKKKKKKVAERDETNHAQHHKKERKKTR